MKKSLFLSFIFKGISVYSQDLQKIDSLNVIIGNHSNADDWKQLNDSFARKNSIKVEEEKEIENIGKYLNPEAFSKDALNINN